jgi:hypothetical protein
LAVNGDSHRAAERGQESADLGRSTVHNSLLGLFGLAVGDFLLN